MVRSLRDVNPDADHLNGIETDASTEPPNPVTVASVSPPASCSVNEAVYDRMMFNDDFLP